MIALLSSPGFTTILQHAYMNIRSTSYSAFPAQTKQTQSFHFRFHLLSHSSKHNNFAMLCLQAAYRLRAVPRARNSVFIFFANSYSLKPTISSFYKRNSFSITFEIKFYQNQVLAVFVVQVMAEHILLRLEKLALCTGPATLYQHLIYASFTLNLNYAPKSQKS